MIDTAIGWIVLGPVFMIAITVGFWVLCTIGGFVENNDKKNQD